MDINTHIARAENLVNLLDNKFKIFGFKFGLDPIIGLIPAVGDILPVAVSAYLMWIGYKTGMPTNRLIQMGFYTFLDVVIGEIVVLGDVFDFFYKSHTKNLQLLKRHLATIAEI